MQKLIRNALFLIVYTILAIPLGYLVRLLLSQYLTIEEFGLFYAIIGFFGLIGIFNDLGFSDSQIYFLPKYLQRNEYNKIKAAIKVQFINQFITTLLIGILIFLGANYLSHYFFHFENATPIIITMIVYFIASDFLKNTQTAFAAFQERTIIGSSEFIRLASTVITLFLAFSFFHVEGLIIVAWIWVIIHISIAVIYSVIFVKQHPKIFMAGDYPIKDIYKEFIPFSINILLVNSASVIFPATTSVLLTYLRGVKEVALYNIAEPISNILLAIVTPLASLLFPLSSQLDERKDYISIQKIINGILNLGVFILLPLVVTLAYYSDEIISILFGNKFIGASPSVKVFTIYVFVTVINKFIFNIVVGLGIQTARTKLICTAALVNTLTAFILIPPYGSMGAIISVTISQIVLLIGGIFLLKKKISFILPVNNYFKMLFLLACYIILQICLKQISDSNLFGQVMITSVKVCIGLVLYYSIGTHFLKIVDIKTIIGIINTNFPKISEYFKK